MTAILLQLAAEGTDDAGIIFVLAAATAVAGAFVAYQAYRGYRRNGSRPMLFLAVGVLLLTTIPVGVNSLLSTVPGWTDAEILLAVTVAHLSGVVSILYALTRA